MCIKLLENNTLPSAIPEYVSFACRMCIQNFFQIKLIIMKAVKVVILEEFFMQRHDFVYSSHNKMTHDYQCCELNSFM